MKKYINLKGPNGEIKKLRVDEKPMLWKILGTIMIISGIFALYGVVYEETLYGKLYDTLDGVVSCYLGLYCIRELIEFHKLIVKGWVKNKGYVAADEEAEQYLLEKNI